MVDTAAGPGLGSIEHVVVLMLENRSFDHMLGYLYRDAGNVSPAGQPFDGLTGRESNPDSSGAAVPVSQITPATPNAYFMPGADPGEGYLATEQDIMSCFTPEALPVISALAQGYAACDQWFSSAPTETMPNRAFVCSGTSQGHLDDKTHTFTSPSIFGLLNSNNLGWAIYGYDATPLTKETFTDIAGADASHFGLFKDFQAAAAAGTLPPFTFLEPSWETTGNSQHPNYDVALGEQLIHDVYEALRSGPGWPQTLFVLTYDEHGGCYDHVAPPWGATPPDSTAGEFGFGFSRFGVRVPTVLVSPLIAPGTVYRVPAGGTPLDHTSILKTVEQRWSLPALTARDAAAPAFGDVLTLTAARTDDVLAGVTVPVSGGTSPAAGQLSHLEAIREELLSRQLPAGAHPIPPGNAVIEP